MDGVAAEIAAKPHLSAEQRWVYHCGLRPSEMLTSDGAILADFPALPPIPLADFSTWPRRTLSSRHRSDSELRSLFHREAAAVVALPLAGLRLPQCSSHRRDDLAYQLHSWDCRMPQFRHRFLRGLPLIEKQQAHDAVPECAATVIFWEIHLQPCSYLPIGGPRTAQCRLGPADAQPLAAHRRASAALPIECGRQRTIGACDGRGTGLRAGARAGRGEGSEFL